MLATLVHELGHAALPNSSHRAPFPGLMRKLALEGKPTATHAGEAFKDRAAPVLAKLGTLPHAALTAISPHKKQTTRMHKCKCEACGYVARVASKWLEDVGAPHCPEHGEMQIA